MFFGRDATCVDSLVGACWNTGFQDSSTDRNIPSDQGIYCRFCASWELYLCLLFCTIWAIAAVGDIHHLISVLRVWTSSCVGIPIDHNVFTAFPIISCQYAAHCSGVKYHWDTKDCNSPKDILDNAAQLSILITAVNLSLLWPRRDS